MGRSIFTVPELMARIAGITEAEEGRFSDVPGWDGDIVSMGREYKAVLVRAGARGEPLKEVWLPLSQLRKAGDEQSIYASNWILEQKSII